MISNSEFYRKQISKVKIEPIKPDNFEKIVSTTLLSNSNIDQQVVSFYHRRDGLYYRGHVVGQEKARKSNEAQCPIPSKSKSPELSSPSPTVEDRNSPRKRKSIKIKSRPKSELDLTLPKWIVYGIDTGRYHLIPIDRLYPLDDKFQTTKPFAISCRLHDYTIPIKSQEVQK